MFPVFMLMLHTISSGLEKLCVPEVVFYTVDIVVCSSGFSQSSPGPGQGLLLLNCLC